MIQIMIIINQIRNGCWIYEMIRIIYISMCLRDVCIHVRASVPACVCMCACVYICVCISVYVCVCVCTCTWVQCLYLRVHVCIYVRVSMRTCMRTCTCVQACACMLMRVLVRMLTFVRVCTHGVCVYVHVSVCA